MLRIRIWIVAALTLGAASSVGAAPILLDRHPERVVKMEIAEESRSDVTRGAPVEGPWRIVHTIDGVRTWEARLPVRPRTLFFHRPPAGMTLKRHQQQGPGETISHAGDLADMAKVDSWAFTQDTIHIRRALGEGPPDDGEYRVRYSRATTRERSLNRSMSDLELADFVFRSLQVGDTTRHGLFLPAPSTIGFTVDVPEGGWLRFDAAIIPPESSLSNTHSDGAFVNVRIGDETSKHQFDVTEMVHRIELDLSPWEGETVELHFETDPGPSTALDYVFLAEPTVYVPDESAPQMVLIFIDTLRPDAMSLYGYERETTPKLDAWAEDAAVFTQARSIAPWTLPSARTMVTGTHPERWDKVDSLQARLANAGWATGMIAGNVYLSSNFNMSDGWGTHRCINWPQGSMQITRGLEFLDAHEGQPTFLLLHLMDMHLPYTEPLQYRGLFVDETPSAFSDSYFLRHDVTRAVRASGEEGRAYVRGRYDNNMRYLDDQLQRIFSELNEDATVMIVSDHGEEFWDHGGFEHGHTLHDELLRVPMILSGPGVTPGRFDSPTSLLDVAPTLAGIQEIDTVGMVGSDLRALASGDATTQFQERPQAFGRPLYGLRRWGSLHQGMKYTVHEGKEALYNVDKDPGEQRTLIGKQDAAPMRKALSDALERPFVQALRVVLNKSKSGSPVRVTFNQPMEAAWVGDDPTMKGKAKVTIEENRTTARWSKQSGMVEVFMLPGAEQADTLDVRIKIGKRAEAHTIVLKDRNAPKAGSPDILLNTSFGGRKVKITTTWVPIPSDLDSAIEGFDSEVQGDLESLGYIETETEK
jgi:arylsulfatase